MKLGTAFGNTDNLRIKTFVLGGQEFRVRVPLTKEMEEIGKRCDAIDQEKFDARFQQTVKGLKPDEHVVVEGDDYIVDGRSTKELVTTAMRLENRVVEYIKLLVPVDGTTLGDLTYEEVDAEWPLSVQLEILTKISEAIQPGYKDARKNS